MSKLILAMLISVFIGGCVPSQKERCASFREKVVLYPEVDLFQYTMPYNSNPENEISMLLRQNKEIKIKSINSAHGTVFIYLERKH